MKSKILWICAIIFVLLSPVFIRWFSLAPAVVVQAENVTSRVIRDSVLASGNLIYLDEAQLSPEIIAKVITVLVKEGDNVKKGQVLITLDDQDLQVVVSLQKAQLAIDLENVARQRINVKNLSQQFDRFSSLLDRGFVSKENYENSLYSLAAAKSELETSILNVVRTRAVLNQANKQLRLSVIKSPMSGTVITLGIKPGETAVPNATGIPGSSLMTIANRESIVLDLNVDENDVSKLSTGDEAFITCPTFPRNAVVGTIREVALGPRRIERGFMANNAAGRLYSVKVVLEDIPISKLRQGMSCRGKIYTTNPDPILAVPVQAVISDQLFDDDGISLSQGAEERGRQYVYVISDGRAVKRSIKIGIADDEHQGIREGLSANDLVIVGPYKIFSSLIDHTRVSVQIREGHTNDVLD